MNTRTTTSDLTPMMRQYLQIKEQNKDAILFFRLGDFYEMFFDDALEATRILHITLTSRDGGKGKKVPMCGVPHHAANNYIARLVKHGRKVAICEQVEEPSPGKNLVKRDITRIITPGTFIADEMLDASVNNYILSINHSGGRYGLAYADISTGEFRVTEISDRETALSELYKISPAECLIPEGLSGADHFKDLRNVSLGAVTVKEDWAFDRELSAGEIKRHFSVDTLEGFGCQDMEAAIGAAGALLKYLKDTQRSALSNIGGITSYRTGRYMLLDRNSQRHLELVQNQEDLSTSGTLLEALDLTQTPMGRRALKRWILNPLIDAKDINFRLDSVEYLYSDNTLREAVRALLDDMYDVERLSSKMSMGSANGRDMVCLSPSLKKVAELKSLRTGDMPGRVAAILSGIEDFRELSEEIDRCMEQDPPLAIKEGGLIRKGYDAEVDELRGLITDGRDWVASLQKQEAERTGISSLKIGYNRVFGYYIEVTKTNLKDVPGDYIRKQTLVNAERFITPELKEY